MGRILLNGVEISTSERSETVLQSKNGSAWTPKVNGKHNKHVHHVNLNGKGDMMLLGNHVANMIQVNNPKYKEVLPGLESWQAHKIASWHNIEGHSIQWLSVVCIDRRGKLPDHPCL
jgi:hypothetical protein